MADKGIIVIVNGLDKDFRGEAFTNIEQLMTRAEEVKNYMQFVLNVEI